MRKYLIALALLLAPSAHGAFAYVTGCANTASAATVNCTIATTVGQIVFVSGIENGTASFTVASTGVGDSWSPALSICTNVGSSQSTQIFSMVPTASTGSDIVTVSAASVFFIGLSVSSYTGQAASSPIGASHCGSGNGTAISSGAFTVSNGNLIVGGAIAGGGGITAGSGFTLRQSSTYTGIEDQVVSGTSATATFTQTTGNWAATGVEVNIAAGAAASKTQVGAFLTGP